MSQTIFNNQIGYSLTPLFRGINGTIVIPSETQSREFDPKLLVACMLAEKGHGVIVGSRVEIHNNIHRLKPLLYMAKDFRKPSHRIFKILKGLGSAIFAWDEEGVLMFSRELYYKRRVYEKALSMVDQLFAWGPINARLIKEAPGYRQQPLHLTGNPRIDLLRPELRQVFRSDVAELRARYGRFILINTNFGKLNHHLSKYVAKAGGYDHVTGQKSTLEMDEAWSHQTKVFEGFKELVGPLSERYPDLNIVIRPHPSENPNLWSEIAEKYHNVFALHEGPVQPWLIGAELLIHSSCTTGIESYLLHRPTISYRPAKSDRFDHEKANNLSVQAFSQVELFEAIDSVLKGANGNIDSEEKSATASELFSNIKGPLASQQIADLIDDFTAGQTLNAASVFARNFAFLHATARTAFRQFTSHLKGHKHSSAYTKKRFPGLAVKEVNDRIDDFQRELGRFQGVRARQLKPNIFIVARQERIT